VADQSEDERRERTRAADRRASADPCDRPRRLAELVTELTGTAPSSALHAVRSSSIEADSLAVVARAMVEIDGPPPEGFRVAGYVSHPRGVGSTDELRRVRPDQHDTI